MIADEDDGFLDGTVMRIVAGVVIVACVGILAYLNRDKLVDRPRADVANLNAQFVKCRDERGGQVDKMLTEGVIKQDKVGEFKERAIATCAGQFPPQEQTEDPY